MIARSFVPLVAWALVAPTAHAQDTTPPPPAPPAESTAAPKAPRSSSTQITYEDIERLRGTVATAYDVVQRLRPRWFQPPRPSTMPLPGTQRVVQSVRVYVDDQDMGGTDFLRSVAAGQIYTLRYMTMTEVGARFGPSSGPGIIVTLKH